MLSISHLFSIITETKMKYLPKSDSIFPKTVRLDILLDKPDDSSYNDVSYAKLSNLQLGKDIENSDLLGLTTDDTFDRFEDYEEESYIDNTEVYRDTFPAGKEPELGGFYVNTGKLKLKSSLAPSNSADKGNKKKIKTKSKTVQSKTIRKRERSRLKDKNPKHENKKRRVNHKMYSNIRLDTLLKTVRNQKKNGIVKNIKMPNTSKHTSVTSASRKAKEICKKKAHFTKKCVQPSSTAKVILNSTEVTIPIQDFLRSKTVSSHSLTSTSDTDDVEILKEIVHSVHKNNNENPFVKNNLKTAMTSESSQVATSKEMFLPSIKIAAPSVSVNSSLPANTTTPSNSHERNFLKEAFSKSSRTPDAVFPLHSSSTTMHNLSPNLTFVKSSPTLDTKSSPATLYPTSAAKMTFQSSQGKIKPDFITITPVLKAKKRSNSPTASISKSINSNTIMPNTVRSSSEAIVVPVRSISTKTTIPKEVLHSPCKVTTENAPLTMSESTVSKVPIKPVYSNSSPVTIKPVYSNSSKVTIKPVYSNSSNVTIKPVHPNSSKVTIKPVHSSSSKVNINLVHSSSTELIHLGSSEATISAVHSNFFKPTIKPVHSNSSKETIKSVHLSSSEAFIEPARSISSNATIPKEVLHSYKTTSDPAFIPNSPMLNPGMRSSFSKRIVPRKEFNSSKLTTESGSIQDFPLSAATMPTDNIAPLNNKDIRPANTWDHLTMNSPSPKTVSKFMLNVIHDSGVNNNNPPNSISEFPSNLQSDFFYQEPNTNSLRTYSKVNKNLFQPIMKTNPAAISVVPVSQAKQSAVVNTTRPSCNTTSVNMYKMNISPIVKHKEPRNQS